MPRLLSTETSTDVCSVALLENNRLVAETIINRPRLHAERLTTAVRDVLANGLDTGVAELGSIDALVVSAGPGSYTGLRIGVSVVKGLAFAHDIPIIGIPSLEVIAAEAASRAMQGDHICVLRDARKNEVYCSIFRVSDEDASGFLTCTRPPTVTTYEELNTVLEGVGEGTTWLAGTAQCRAAADNLRSEVQIYEPTRPAPTAYWVGRCALHRFEAGDFEDLESFEPQYIRPFHTHERKPLFQGLTGSS